MKKLYEFTNNKRKFVITKPNRRQTEEADTQYAVEMSKCVKRGILTKSMLAKKYADAGGIWTEEAAKQLSGMYKRLNDMIAEQTRLATVKSQTKKNKAKAAEITDNMVELKREIVEAETSNLSLFNQTAESKAQNMIIVWYATHLLMEEINKELVPFFDGEDFEEKLDQYYEREDEDDNEEYVEIMQKVGTVVAFWFFNQGQGQDKFDELLKEFLGEKEEKEEKKEEGESPADE
jgi:hypothetical protein